VNTILECGQYLATSSALEHADFCVGYTGVWGDTPVNQLFFYDMKLDQLKAKMKELLTQGYLLAKVHFYADTARRVPSIAALFQNDGKGGMHDLVVTTDWNTFEATSQKYLTTPRVAERLKLADVQIFDEADMKKRW
jgi:hypothetical protein